MDINALRKISSILGNNALLVQAAGGNTSLKHDNKITIKASGKWLSEAMNENIFVTLDLPPLQQAIYKKHNTAFTEYVVDDSNLRPSIETSLHALLPHKVVAHVHSINTLAYAVCQNGQTDLQQLLTNFNWAWVDYHKPGQALTTAVMEIVEQQLPDILILANHGIVVGAESCDAALTLLNQIEKILLRNLRDVDATEKFNSQNKALPKGWKLPKHALTHSLAIDPISFKLACNGAMYPDHVVFLGDKPQTLMADNNMDNSLAALSSANYALCKDVGVIVKSDVSPAVEEMLLCQAELLQRLNGTEQIRYLNEKEITELLNWDAEKYRQQLQS